MIYGDPIAHFPVSKFASIARHLLIGAITLGAYLIVGLILFLTATINLGSFLFFFVAISLVAAVICAITLLKQEKTEYFIYHSGIKICSNGKKYELSYGKIEKIELKHLHRNKCKGTIEFIPYEEHRLRGVRFYFKNLPNVDKLYEALNKLYLSNNSASLTISEWLDFNFSDEYYDDAMVIIFNVYRTGHTGRFNFEISGNYVTEENYNSYIEEYGEEQSPETDDVKSFDEYPYPYVDEYCFLLKVDHPFDAQSEDEAYNLTKEELLKYVESGRYSDRMKKCKAIYLTDENKLDRIH